MKNLRLSTTLAIITAGIILAWAWSRSLNTAPTASLPWEIYTGAFYLSGLLAIGLMSVTLMLSTRPAWLETPFKGLDQLYRLHRWTGMLAVVFAVLHWLIEMGDDVVESLFGRESRLPKEDFSGFVELMRDSSEDVGEWAFYLVVAMVVLSLWKRFPYKPWSYLHRAMPALYLLLVFHTVWLAPLAWWQQPVGVLMALLLTGGSLAAILSLRGKLGQSRQVQGTITNVSTLTKGITEVGCQLGKKWHGHRAGQFAFVTLDPFEGAHPFTIASSDQGNGRLSFQIKALGDYTKRLDQSLKVGQAVTVEGPYGRFNFKRRNAHAEQLWIAGGIGITPFLAWLEALQEQPDQSPVAQLHYATRDRATDPFVARLQQSCSRLAGIQLHIYDSLQGEKLTSEQLITQHSKKGALEVWFCGPTGWAKTLEKELRERLEGSLAFHKEAFELR
ncbi:MAG: putative ferric reductase [Motiliproteus sp.]